MYKYTLCFIRRDCQLLLLNRQKKPNMGRWNGVGGKLEAGETPEQGILREVTEETGIRLASAAFAGTVTWETPNGIGGMYVYLTDVSPDFHYPTPVAVEEGLLDWKPLDWVLNTDNQGIAENIHLFLPSMLAGERWDHRFTYDEHDRAIGYARGPLQYDPAVSNY